MNYQWAFGPFSPALSGDVERNMVAEIARFGQGTTVADQAGALSALIKSKRHHQASKEPQFVQGVEALLRAASDSLDPAERTIATATLLRIGGLIKAWQPRIAESLNRVLTRPLPPLESIVDPNDRYYVATFWRFAKPEWARQYLAAAAIEEEGSEKVRLECLEGLFAFAPNLSSVLQELMMPMRRLTVQTEKPGDSKGRRLRRLLDAVRVAFAAVSSEPGDSAGTDLETLLADTFKNSGPPITESVMQEAAEQVLALVHEMVKSRFSVATSPNTFASINIARGWFREKDWEDFVESSPAAQLVCRDIAEAIEILVRAGIGDDELQQRLVWAAGSTSKARERLKGILDRNPGLSEELSRWLSGATARKRSALAAQSQILSFEEALSDVLIDSERLLEVSEQVRRDVVPELSVFLPEAMPAVENLLGLVRTTFGTIDSAARSRSVKMSGKIGMVLDFSPLEHEMVGGVNPGIRQVRIVRPGVEAPGEGGGRRIIRKALVEAAV